MSYTGKHDRSGVAHDADNYHTALSSVRGTHFQKNTDISGEASEQGHGYHSKDVFKSRWELESDNMIYQLRDKFRSLQMQPDEEKTLQTLAHSPSKISQASSADM